MFTGAETEQPPAASLDKPASVSARTGANLHTALGDQPSAAAKQSPSKSPGYVRKPMPINEPKPILPKSKQINLDQAPAKQPAKQAVTAVSRKLAEENNQQMETQRKKFMRKLSQEDQLQTQGADTNEGAKLRGTDDGRIKKCSTSPLSPRLHSKARPSTLMLDKREKFKRSSAVSATPSTDSSKSSKTFEFIDYDEETKEKIIQDALKEEEEFLEFVKTLDMEPPDPIIEATSRELPGAGAGSLELPGAGSRGQENLDSLCRMMEEIAVLKDENNKLTERLHGIQPLQPQYDAAPQVRTWLADTAGARCRQTCWRCLAMFESLDVKEAINLNIDKHRLHV